MKKLIKLAVFVGLIVAVAKLLEAKKREWQGLSEIEARAKIDAKLPDKIPVEKRAEVTDEEAEIGLRLPQPAEESDGEPGGQGAER